MRRTILLADDSPTIRRLVRQTFADSDFEIVEASNGDAAIKALEEIRPHVVLADIYMPGKNGYQVCAYVRNQPELSQIPVVLLVGAFDAFDEQSARQVGATANITKPFEPGALVELVLSIMLPETEEPPIVPVPEPRSEPVETGTPLPSPAVTEAPAPDAEDLLGLETIFRDEHERLSPSLLADEDIDRIADRVIQKVSSQVIESIAWDIVPDITEKIVREELKRIR
jgi:CheY-like chemotaxis protein